MTSKSSASSPVPHSTVQSHTQKDYATAFGTLQCQYGLGGLRTPALPKKDTSMRKWYRWGQSRSSSTASLIRSTTPSDTTPPSRRAVPTQGALTESELRFGKLMAEYGLGPISQVQFSRK